MELAKRVKAKPLRYTEALHSQSLLMLFQKSSTRTRVSFEAGMTQLGGHAIYLDWDSTNFRLSKIRYEAACLSHNTIMLMARLKKHADLLELKKGASVPLVNGCCDRYHPCQVLADVLTIYEDCGYLQGAKLSYVGVHNNIANSLVEIAHILGINLSLVCPVSSKEIVDLKMKQSLSQKGLLTETLNIKSAVEHTDYVYTDTWLDMEFFEQPEYAAIREQRSERMMPYQINTKVMQDSRAKIMHPMPIHPGYEISAEMVEDPRSLIFSQAANRIHVQKAVILYLLGLD